MEGLQNANNSAAVFGVRLDRMSPSTVRRFLALLSLMCLSFSALPGFAAPWLPYGPYGGHARSFAVDPTNHAHVYLGTVNGWIYDSHDAGAHWSRLARVGKRDDLALDHILTDPLNPRHLIVGAWVLDHPDGGIYQSFDAGKTWAPQMQMQGQSVRALTSAPSDPKVLIAGTLNGIFRSGDSGKNWNLISPADSNEIHNFQSVAVAPDDSKVIYGGTWHLPWKTTDGGENWSNIKTGIIDDSDVFSIIVDPQNPNVVYASACSGIYKSEDAAGHFRKVQGIPSTARRTRVLKQDPEHLNIVFAGTTEGLWRTNDSGATWKRTTGPEVIVNDVSIDTTNTQHVLLATERGGVLLSEDGGDSFVPANEGFSTRQISAFLVDAARPGLMYVGVVNDKEWGGVFLSRDGGLSWYQRSEGLQGRDVFSLAQAPDGTLVAGTSHGIFRYEDIVWTRSLGASMLGDAPTRARTRSVAKSTPRRGAAAKKTGHGKVQSSGKKPAAVVPSVATVPALDGAGSFDGMVHSIVTVGDRMFAASSRGLLVSTDSGRSWARVPSMGGDEWRFLATDKRVVVASSLDKMMASTDGGATWADMSLPPKVLQVTALAVDGRGEIWAAGREGVFVSSNIGMSWQGLSNLYVRNVDSLYFDGRSNQLLVTANGDTTIAYGLEVATRKVTYWDTGWTLRFLRPVGDHYLGATLFDGVVIQPRMIDASQAVGTKVGLGGGGD
jgi:photosystem II stability/assembly factor-like uncharacterized protein